MAATMSKTTMWAVMKNGRTYMILPTLDEAETYYGLHSKNGFSKHKWTIRKAIVMFPYETAAERKARLDRHVQQVVEFNAALSRR